MSQTRINANASSPAGAAVASSSGNSIITQTTTKRARSRGEDEEEEEAGTTTSVMDTLRASASPAVRIDKPTAEATTASGKQIESPTAATTATTTAAVIPATGATEEEEDEDEDEAVYFRNESKFKVWRKHVRDTYQTLAHYELRWPHRTVQLLPFMSVLSSSSAADNRAEQLLLTGTSTGGEEQNYLKLLRVVLPTSPQKFTEDYDPDMRDLGGYGYCPTYVTCSVKMRMFHDGDVIKARYMPSNPNIIATSSDNGNVYVFDRTTIALGKAPNDPSRPLLPPHPADDATQTVKDQYREKRRQQRKWDTNRGDSQHKAILSGNACAGVALDWDRSMSGKLVCGAASRISVWAVGELQRRDNKTYDPIVSIDLDKAIGSNNNNNNMAAIQDAKFSWFNDSLVACGLEKGRLSLSDLRMGAEASSSTTSFHTLQDGAADVLACDWSPHDENRIALGDAAGNVAVYDLRASSSSSNTSSSAMTPLYRSEPGLAHEPGTEVTSVQWCPHNHNILMSCGEDGNTVFHRLVPTSSSQSGSMSQLFKHSAHTSPVMDGCWSWQDCYAGQAVTVDDTAICVWKPRNCFWKE